MDVGAEVAWAAAPSPSLANVDQIKLSLHSGISDVDAAAAACNY